LKSFISVMIGCLLWVCWLGDAAAQTLRSAAAEWQPWQMVENGHLKGITPDILSELAKRTGLTIDIQWLPHKRVMAAFKKGTIDMEPTVNPAWRESSSEPSVYTQPFFVTRDIILVNKASGIRGTSVEDFYGLKVGCGLGYYYPEGFQEAFNRKDILREDNPVSETNLKKLALLRLDGIIVDKIQARYILKKAHLNPADFATAYAFNPSELSMRLRYSHRDLLPALNTALGGMQADGTIDRIVKRYLR